MDEPRVDTSAEAVERLERLLDPAEGLLPRADAWALATLRAIARERDDYRVQLEKVTDPVYLTGLLEKIGVVDAEAAKAGFDELLADAVAALARAEAAEAERDALRVVASAAEALRGADRLGYGVNDAFREMTAALDALPPGSLQSEG
jgi:hypothetical protein